MQESKIKVQTKVPLRGLSTFKIGGDASHLFMLENKKDLKDAVAYAKENDLPIFVLGGGSNILFADSGISAFVIQVLNKGKEYKKIDDLHVLVTAEAGETWDDFVKWTIENHFFGLENLSSIPGTVGASPVQNIGAYGVEVKDLIESVEVFNIQTSEYKTLTNTECAFGYRNSFFKTEEGKNLIVVSVTFTLSLVPNINISYKDLSNHFKDIVPTPFEVRDAVIEIRKGKFPDLNIHGTAGSFFKNIICNESDIAKLKADYPLMPVYKAGSGFVKISTAFVLDKVCGLKGFRIGNVGLYENQSLVVVNYADATSTDVREFISKIKSIVEQKTGIRIEEEVILA
ncbi:MAG: UDP-N-acetylenolpyruvoylglucosamine reductase, UDP-N-acetylmuramate dehydrogenase [Candidatus Taylorbacteria bacterium]|nr:UDP-N-acetylenolpyruvoylglucosamine reductase, UDP-N-acetylmuramate dehydrogenase [Candidatus Taylorbacteria bacterium]